MGLFSFRLTPLLHFTFKGRQRAFDNFSERRTMHEFAAFVARRSAIDDLMEIGRARVAKSGIEKHSAADLREIGRLGGCGRADSP